MQSQYQPRSGVHFLLLYAFLFSLMGVCVKLVAHLPSQQVVAARMVFMLVTTYAMLRAHKVSALGVVNKKLLLLRGLTGTLALNCCFYAMAHMPIAEAILIQNTTPVFTGLLAAIFLHERRHWSVALTTGVSMVGVLIMTRPEVVFGEAHARMDLWPVVAAVGGAVFTASSFVIIRRIGQQEHSLTVTFTVPFVGVLLTVPVSATNWVMPTTGEWAILGILGLVSQLSQMALAVGIRREPVARVTNLTHAQLVFATIWGALLFNEYPDTWTLVGATVVVSASILTVILARNDHQPPEFDSNNTGTRTLPMQTLVVEPTEPGEDSIPRAVAAELSGARTPTAN